MSRGAGSWQVLEDGTQGVTSLANLAAPSHDLPYKPLELGSDATDVQTLRGRHFMAACCELAYEPSPVMEDTVSRSSPPVCKHCWRRGSVAEVPPPCYQYKTDKPGYNPHLPADTGGMPGTLSMLCAAASRPGQPRLRDVSGLSLSQAVWCRWGLRWEGTSHTSGRLCQEGYAADCTWLCCSMPGQVLLAFRGADPLTQIDRRADIPTACMKVKGGPVSAYVALGASAAWTCTAAVLH